MEGAKLKKYRDTYCAVWRADGSTRRASLRTSDLNEARRRFVDWQNAGKRSGETVTEIVEAYLLDKASKASSVVMHWSWKPLKPVFGHLRPEQVDRAISRAYAAQRRRHKRSESTIVRELSLLRAALRWHNKATPAVVEVPAAPPPRTYFLTRTEWTKFRQAALVTPHIHLFSVLAYTTAGRAQAILELTWDRVDFGRGLINLGVAATRFKGRAVVPMNTTARSALEEAKKAALTDNVVEWGGKSLASIKKGFAAAALRAGFPDLTPHVLRHSAAVHMAEAGVPMSEIAQYLGHSSTNVTERVYARFSPDYLRKAAAALD